MPTPDTEALSACLQACTQAYANANQGSDAHPLGLAEVGTIQELIPRLQTVPSVKGGFAIRFKDGTTYFINVHRMPSEEELSKLPPAAPPSPPRT